MYIYIPQHNPMPFLKALKLLQGRKFASREIEYASHMCQLCLATIHNSTIYLYAACMYPTYVYMYIIYVYILFYVICEIFNTY